MQEQGYLGASISILLYQNVIKLSQVCSYTIRLAAPLETSSCVVLALRAYNKVGLYSTVRRNLGGCNVASKVKLIVVDAVATTLDG